MSDIQHLIMGLSSKEPKTKQDILEEMEDIENLKWKIKTPYVLANLDKRKKKLQAILEIKEKEIEKNAEKIIKSYSKTKFTKISQFGNDGLPEDYLDEGRLEYADDPEIPDRPKDIDDLGDLGASEDYLDEGGLEYADDPEISEDLEDSGDLGDLFSPMDQNKEFFDILREELAAEGLGDGLEGDLESDANLGPDLESDANLGPDLEADANLGPDLEDDANLGPDLEADYFNNDSPILEPKFNNDLPIKNHKDRFNNNKDMLGGNKLSSNKLSKFKTIKLSQIFSDDEDDESSDLEGLLKHLLDKDDQEDEFEEDLKQCHECGGELQELGKLGSKQWFRCRNCGSEQAEDIEDNIF